MMTKEEIAAYHEAAHAVQTVASNWLHLAGSVGLATEGYGHADIKMDQSKIKAAFLDPSFDMDEPRREFVHALLAGACAEHRLVALGLADISERDIRAAANGDYAIAVAQLRKMSPPEEDQLSGYEAATLGILEGAVPWCIVHRFAQVLLERNSIPAAEATRIISEIGDACEAGTPAAEQNGSTG